MTAEPSRAERARTLVESGLLGTLATLLADRGGAPFASLVPYGLETGGQPTFLLSALAVHTRNLAADPRASLLVAAGETMGAPRVTLVGRVQRVPAGEEAAVRASYLARQPDARAWAGLADFGCHRLGVEAAYLVGGFGDVGWVRAADWAAAAPDPLAPAAARIVAHMNADHADALVLYCRVFAGVAADAATMTAVDRLGFAVRARIGSDERQVRIAFPEEVRTPDAARTALVEMLRTARGGAGGASH